MSAHYSRLSARFEQAHLFEDREVYPPASHDIQRLVDDYDADIVALDDGTLVRLEPASATPAWIRRGQERLAKDLTGQLR